MKSVMTKKLKVYKVEWTIKDYTYIPSTSVNEGHYIPCNGYEIITIDSADNAKKVAQLINPNAKIKRPKILYKIEE